MAVTIEEQIQAIVLEIKMFTIHADRQLDGSVRVQLGKMANSPVGVGANFSDAFAKALLKAAFPGIKQGIPF